MLASSHRRVVAQATSVLTLGRVYELIANNNPRAKEKRTRRTVPSITDEERL